MQPDMNPSRRTVLTGIGTLAAGGAGLAAFSGSGAAAESNIAVEDAPTVTTDDGTVEWVAVKLWVRTEWDGFDSDVHYVRYTDEVTIAPNGADETYTINQTLSDDLDGGKSPGGEGWGGDDGYHGGEHYSDAGKAGYIHADVDWGIIQRNRENTYNQGYGLPNNPAPAETLFADDDGATNETLVRLDKQIRLYDADENPLTGPDGSQGVADPSVSAEFVVTVENEAANTSNAGDGEALASGENEEI